MMRVNNLKDAEEFFQRALKIEPDEPSSLLQLGQIRYRQGSLEEARKLVGRFNRLVAPTAERLWRRARAGAAGAGTVARGHRAAAQVRRAPARGSRAGALRCPAGRHLRAR